MFCSLFAAAAVLLTLALPTFPDGLSPAILLFLGLVGLAGLAGALRSRPARVQLVLFLPWLAALLVALFVGLLRGTPMVQALEDALPYVLFVLGITAGRGASAPRMLLAAILAVAAIDGFVSLWRMPSFDLSVVRSTYTSHKVIAGHLLVGITLAAVLRLLTPPSQRLVRGLFVGLAGLLVLAVIATVSRGMLLGLSVGLVAALYVRRPVRGLSLSLFGLLTLAVFAGTFWDLGTQYLRLGSSATVDGRVREITQCLEVFLDAPAFGAGLGHEILVDGFYVSYVHNMVAYHLWKFGMFGSVLLSIPFVPLVREALRAPPLLRPTIVGGALSIGLYLVTAASYKSYFLVPMVGMAVGAILAIVARTSEAKQAAPR
ncbi:MAG: hypothetical protein KC486_23405 [Myxococcales bacterium]|nr:hypothetical protein [Myxococcales bacterium]